MSESCEFRANFKIPHSGLAFHLKSWHPALIVALPAVSILQIL